MKICTLVLVSLLCACSGGGSSNDKKNEEVKNQAPVAAITLDATSIVLDNSITVSGTTSSDPDGDALTFQWAIKNEDGDDYPLTNNSAENFVFIPEDFGIYTITLIVKDNEISSQPITSTVTVEPNAQSYPVATISGDNQVNSNIQTKIGEVNWFSAENSTATTGQQLTYHWTLSSKPAASTSVIGDADKVKAYLITDVAGNYEITLTVTNTINELTATKVLAIIAEELLVNSQPVAAISTPLPSYKIGQTVKLNASNSYDSDNNQLTYLWKLTPPAGVANVSLSGDTTEFVEFIVEDLGDYQVTLEVSDGTLTHETSITINVTNDNIAPVANAGEDKIANLGIVLELDGSASSDADGDDLQYKWSVVSKPVTSEYENPNDFNGYHKFSFMADVIGEYVLSLQVFDGINYSATDQVHINVVENQKPVAILPDDIAIQIQGAQTITSADSYDPEGRPLTYTWELINKPEGSEASALSLISVPTTRFTVDLPGTYTLQLIVNDGVQNSLPATMSIVYTAEEWHEVTVTGQLVDDGGLPVPMVKVTGFFQTDVFSDENGNFDILLRSKAEDAALTTLLFRFTEQLAARLKLPEEYEPIQTLGKVKVPVFQRKDITLAACPTYIGAEQVEVSFYLTPTGYDENMFFYETTKITLTVGAEPIAVKLPATGLLEMFLDTSVGGKIYGDDGEPYFTHQYQLDDSQEDILALTVCN